MTPPQGINARLEELLQLESDCVVVEAELQRTLAENKVRLGEARAEIRGIEFARLVLTPAPGGADPQPQRHSVQRPVMKLLRDVGPGNPLTEEVIAEKTSLPRASVHDFILRAVRDGKIVTDGGLYSLPGEPDAGELKAAAE